MAITISYPQLGKLQNYLENEQITIQEINYLENITVKVAIDITEIDIFIANIIDLFNSQVTITHLEKAYVENPVKKR